MLPMKASDDALSRRWASRVSSLPFVASSPILAAEPKVHRELSYAEPKNERQMLDVYAPIEGKDHPVVVWIHGGGWQAGDKKEEVREIPMPPAPLGLTERGS